MTSIARYRQIFTEKEQVTLTLCSKAYPAIQSLERGFVSDRRGVLNRLPRRGPAGGGPERRRCPGWAPAAVQVQHAQKRGHALAQAQLN
jgi:hypothetical protein